MKKKIVFYIILGVIVFVFFRVVDALLGASVFSVDSSYYTYPPGYYQIKTPDGPSFMHVNSLGIRSDEIQPVKENTRVLFLGDSFTLGPYIEKDDIFVNKSKHILQSKGYNVDHVNAGIIAYGPGNALGLYRAIRDQVKPDIVLYAVYQNDLNDAGETKLYKDTRDRQKRKLLIWLAFALAPNTSNYYLKAYIIKDFQQKLLEMSNPVKKVSKEEIAQLKKSWKEQSKSEKPKSKKEIAFMLYQMVSNYSADTDLSDDEIMDWVKNATNYVSKYGLGSVDLVQLMYGLFEPDYYKISANLEGEGEDYLKKLENVIMVMKTEAESRGQRFGVVFIPAEVMYNREKFDVSKTFNFKLNEAWLKKESPLENKLDAFTEEEKIPYLNLAPYFRKAAPDNYYTFPHDVHFNKKGHSISAQHVAEFLERDFLKD